MNFNNFFGIIKESLRDLTKNIRLIIPGIFLWIFIFLFSKFSYTLNKTFVKTSSLIIWLILFSIMSLSVFSFVFSGLIGFSKSIIKRDIEIPSNAVTPQSGISNRHSRTKGSKIHGNVYKKSFINEFLRNAKKCWFQNLMILLIITMIGSLIWIIAFYGGKFIGESIGMSVNSALILYILIYFIFIVSFLIFFTFSIFFLVLENLSIKESIKKSFKFVKRYYAETLTLNILIFIIIGLFNKIKNPYFDVLEYAILIPLFILIFNRFILNYEGKR